MITPILKIVKLLDQIMSGLNLFESQFPHFFPSCYFSLIFQKICQNLKEVTAEIARKKYNYSRCFHNSTNSALKQSICTIQPYILNYKCKCYWEENFSPRDETTCELPLMKTSHQSNKGYLLLPLWLRNRKPQLLLRFSRRSTLCKPL